jgi:phage terminase large subunit
VTPAQSKIKAWRENPLQFVYENFHVELDDWQKEALAPLGGSDNPRRRAMWRACTGPGKSAALAWAGWHRLACFAERGEHPKGAALSGEGSDNLRDNLWAELSKWQQRSEFLKTAFTWTKERIFANNHGATWFLSARSYAKDANAEAIGTSLSGLHSKFPFILLDETGRMPITVGQKAEQIFTGGVVDGLIAGAGNPVTTQGLLYHVCTALAGQWKIIRITADPDDPKRTPRVDIEHAREQIKLYGRDNGWVMATILGEFPPHGFNTLLSLEQVEKAMGQHYVEEQFAHAQKRLGVDVARFGDDSTVIFPRQGLVAFKPAIMRNARSNEIAARVALAKQRWGSEIEAVDGSGGWGSGVVDSLIQTGFSPLEVSFSGKAINPRYFNKRSEMWFEMAEWVKRGGALPNDPELVRQLTAPMYTLQDGKFRMEEKEQLKKRLGYSPDKADALCLTFALPEMPATRSYPGIASQAGRVLHDWNPLEERQA